MDWKYILSLSHDSISEEEKDELYNLIAWFNYDAEKLDSKKYVALLKISQEIMKYKTEQVEALIAELDEIAVQQGEEEARKQDSSEDVKNLTSKKFTGLEEQKYKEMKIKLRQQIKSNENQEKKIEKLQHQLILMNEEKLHLQSELNSVLNRADESQSSDISETVIDKQKELALMVQEKNKQISQLLTDIESIEADNHHLKKTITDLRENLEDATEQLTTSTNEYTAMKIKFDDATGLTDELKQKNEALRSQIEDLVENRKIRDEEIDKFTVAIDTRVSKWKKILETKDHEMEKLKKQVHISSAHSSSESNLSFHGDKSYNEVLNKLLNEREVQIVELKEQLQSATIEMDKGTGVIQQLTHEKSSCVQQIEEYICIVNDLKTQLKLTHERSQDLHENVTIAESIADSKQNEIDEIIKKLKKDGKMNLAESLEQNQALKSRTRTQERKISSYVKIINKLQNSVDILEQENNALREKCDIASDEEVELNGVLLKKSKEKKDFEKLQKQVLELENEKLELRSKVHNLNRQLATPSTENVKENCSEAKPLKEDLIHSKKNDDVTNTKYVAVLQENDALRKGLQEILECVQTKSQTSRKEIKSETLEKLLRALDMRHISGWYHPAMRLQAELHTLQGVNMELREQLKNLRSQFNDYMKGSKINVMTSQRKNIDETDNRILVKDSHSQNLPKTLNDQEAKDMVNTLTQKLEDYSKNFVIIEEQLNVLYNQYMSEKGIWESKEKEYESDKNKLEEKSAVLEAKLHEFTHFSDDEYKIAERFAEMSENIVISNRKCVFLENQESNLTLEINKISNNLKNAEIAAFQKINQLSLDFKLLQNELKMKDEISHTLVNRELLIEVQNNLDNLMLKYRQLLNNFNTIRTEYSSEFVVLSETVKLLQEQNEELRRTLVNALSSKQKDGTVSLSNEFEVLSNKVAQFEVNEIAEKQRADHMNNLYNLVKDQLEKAENRFENLEKYNQELLNKNLMLQEDITKCENKIVNYVDLAEFKNAKLKYEKILKENEKLSVENDQLKNEQKTIGKVESIATESSNSLEILSLKHQILDLQASSDDKALIARLSSDVIIARLSENRCQKRLEDLEMELKEYQDNCGTFSLLLKEERTNKIQIVEQLHSKISIFEETIREIRRRYLGSAPLLSEDIFNANLQQILKDKMETFKSLEKVRKTQSNCLILEEELNKKLFLVQDFESNIQHCNEDVSQKIKSWHQEKNSILIKQLRNERELEFKSLQIEQIHYKLNSQDELISQLHEELLKGYNTSNNIIPTIDKRIITMASSTQTENENDVIKSTEKLVKFKETQTNHQLDRSSSNENYDSLLITNLKIELNNYKDEMIEKDNRVDQLKLKVTDLEMNVSLFRGQIGDKQSQIMFYEKHILELQTKISKLSDDSLRAGQNKALVPCNSDEIVTLNESLKKLEESNMQKDEVVLKYQTLLKKDRDEHSLAASRMQQEMLRFQDIIVAQDKAYKELQETSIQHPGKAAIEQYILQVHALEKHTVELHTTVSTLNLQLQSSRQESARWQTLANERLDSMEQLRQDLDEQHQNELLAYKRDSEKWCHEIVKLKEMISQHRSEMVTHNDPEIKLKLKEKEDKIHELNVSLRHVKNELRKRTENTESIPSPKFDELELAKEQISKDYESLKKRYEQIINRERALKEELRTLKEQLLKKPVSARSDRSDKEYLLKKIGTLEKEIENLKSKLERQMAINDSHKVAVTEDFEKWKKQKYFQQTAEKLKSKLQEKEDEFNKMNHSCAGYKILIERLEREKYGLENRVKTLRNSQFSADVKRFEILNLENEELRHRIEAVNAKLEMQQHHSGGLGAAMLQDKLEAQERKIAILELSSKGGVEIRGEIERLHSSMENIQKLNLRLEAENLELKLDLEKYKQDIPRLREQIIHLENYIEILKSENESKEPGIQLDDKGNTKQENKKISELERTVFVLKRVVEKLQVENKRFQGGARNGTVTDRMGPPDKIRTDFNRLKEQFGESVQQVAHLEDQLKAANSKIISLETQANSLDLKKISNELTAVKSDLAYKTQLLDRVKILLHRAAVKEKALLEEVKQLKLSANSKI